jgi:hypothetical protein
MIIHKCHSIAKVKLAVCLSTIPYRRIEAMDVSDQLRLRPHYPRYASDRRLGDPHSGRDAFAGVTGVFMQTAMWPKYEGVSKSFQTGRLE